MSNALARYGTGAFAFAGMETHVHHRSEIYGNASALWDIIGFE